MFRLIDRLRADTWCCLFVIYLRYLIGGAFVYAGWGKFWGGRFMPAGTLSVPPEGALPIDLFFEVLYRSGIWWQFLGGGQVLAGALLLTQRFSALGAVMFLPVSLNIFIITISMDFHGTPLITGLLVLANLGLLLWDYRRFGPLVSSNLATQHTLDLPSDQLGWPRYWLGLGTLLLLASLSFGNRESPIGWFVVSMLAGLAGICGYWVLQRRQSGQAVPSK